MKSPLQAKRLVYHVQKYQNQDAFSALYDQYIAPIYRFVHFKIPHQHDAEDITSDIFLKTWDYLTRNAETRVENVRALLYTIARNHIVDYYRDQTKRQQLYSLDLLQERQDIPEREDAESEQIEQIERAQTMTFILKEIKKLKQEYQDVLFLKYLEEYSTREIAKMMGKSQTSVRVTLYRAVKAIKKMIGVEEAEK